ncbi:MAG: hypothetical protein JWN86_1963 [Planctomycetota bacterium]|nr:hypothetical protein [Planctomycetota bacterium]
MRWPRMQFTLRRMLVAVACVATLLGLGVESSRLHRRAVRFRSEAQRYAVCEQFLSAFAVGMGRDATLPSFTPDGGRHTMKIVAGIGSDHAAVMKRKYERAARYPWIAVAPDSPWPN